MFRSLFSWITLLGTRRRTTSLGPASGFDPCFRGSRSSGRALRWPRCPPKSVSILVFVDHAPRDVCHCIGERPWPRFRSLFSWITLLGNIRDIEIVAKNRFRSLFSWITLLGIEDEIGISGRIEFRSLFSWITLLGSPRLFGSARRARRFDPCFRGSRSSGAIQLKPGKVILRFRSLFSWITLLGSAASPAIATT